MDGGAVQDRPRRRLLRLRLRYGMSDGIGPAQRGLQCQLHDQRPLWLEGDRRQGEAVRIELERPADSVADLSIQTFQETYRAIPSRSPVLPPVDLERDHAAPDRKPLRGQLRQRAAP